MKAVAVIGSPRKNGNTEIFSQHVLKAIAEEGLETDLVRLAGLDIRPCNACMACTKELKCVIEDNFDPIFRKMINASGIIVGSPVYFGSATPEIMALLDRAGYVSRRHGHLFSRKVGGPITVARRTGQNFTYAQLLMWFSINGMIVPGSTYWNIAFGGRKTDVLEDEEGVKTIRNFAENMAWLLEKIAKQSSPH